MATAHYEHTCSQCSKTYQKRQAWINPQEYTNPDEPFLTSTFWCPKCELGQAVKLKMLPDVQVMMVEQLNYSGMINEKSPSYYAPSKSKEDNKETEKIETMTQEKALEILSVLR
jgi:hypothetical protein